MTERPGGRALGGRPYLSGGEAPAACGPPAASQRPSVPPHAARHHHRDPRNLLPQVTGSGHDGGPGGEDLGPPRDRVTRPDPEGFRAAKNRFHDPLGNPPAPNAGSPLPHGSSSAAERQPGRANEAADRASSREQSGVGRATLGLAIAARARWLCSDAARPAPPETVESCQPPISRIRVAPSVRGLAARERALVCCRRCRGGRRRRGGRPRP
jgi:hypothetical protein